jgi:hypothetical protein
MGRLFFEESPMNIVARQSVTNDQADWHAGFLEMLPRIVRQAKNSFRHLSPEAKEDAICEVIANACVAYRRLWERNELHRAFPTALTNFGVKRFRAGRRVGSRLNGRDVTSEYCRHKTGVVIESSSQLIQLLTEDRHAGPAEIAASRIDVGAWMSSLPQRTRRLAESLASGESTRSAAKVFGLSPGRISQLRRELHTTWRVFQGEIASATP